MQNIKYNFRFCSFVRPAIWERIMPFRKKQDDKQQQYQTDYSKLMDQVLEASVSNDQLKLSIQQLMEEIKLTLVEAYDYKIIDEVMRQISTQNLCNSAVEQFIGSVTSPRNDMVKEKFLQYAMINAKNDEERQIVQFYRIYLNKLLAIQQGNEKDFSKVNEELLNLAQQNCTIAKHLVAKEMYKVALNQLGSRHKRQKEQMLQESLRMFRECVDEEFHQSFYYIGEMAESGDIPGGINYQFALECFTIAASYDNPSAFFKLAKYYKEGFLVQKNQYLEYYYTKKSAELGLREAMHNLGVMYKEGRVIKQNELKAISWFTHAGNLGYPPSMYNAAMMFQNGSKDGFIVANKKAALVWLEKTHKESDGQFDTQKEINKILKELEEEDNLEK